MLPGGELWAFESSGDGIGGPQIVGVRVASPSPQKTHRIVSDPLFRLHYGFTPGPYAGFTPNDQTRNPYVFRGGAIRVVRIPPS